MMSWPAWQAQSPTHCGRRYGKNRLDILESFVHICPSKNQRARTNTRDSRKNSRVWTIP